MRRADKLERWAAAAIGEGLVQVAMIRDENDLGFVREQQQLVREALESIEARVRPVSEARFELMAQPYRDQIAAIQVEIDEYLARVSPLKMRRSG